MTVQHSILPNERLGREVFSSRHRDRARRSTVPYHVFLERFGQIKISVDRLDLASAEDAAAIGDRNAAWRRRTFYGWAVVGVEHAEANQRRVKATPLEDNPYHAEIVLPEVTGAVRAEQVRHAQELADVSRWQDRSDPP